MEIPGIYKTKDHGGNGRKPRDNNVFVEEESRHVQERSRPVEERSQAEANGYSGESSLLVGAKTLAGVGVGLLTVVVAATAVGLVVETLVVPSLLLKLAGGIAGGGLGMAKGLTDERKVR